MVSMPALTATLMHAYGDEARNVVCVVATDGTTTEFLFPPSAPRSDLDPENTSGLLNVFNERLEHTVSIARPEQPTPEDVINGLVYNNPFTASVVEHDTYDAAKADADKQIALVLSAEESLL